MTNDNRDVEYKEFYHFYILYSSRLTNIYIALWSKTRIALTTGVCHVFINGSHERGFSNLNRAGWWTNTYLYQSIAKSKSPQFPFRQHDYLNQGVHIDACWLVLCKLLFYWYVTWNFKCEWLIIGTIVWFFYIELSAYHMALVLLSLTSFDNCKPILLGSTIVKVAVYLCCIELCPTFPIPLWHFRWKDSWKIGDWKHWLIPIYRAIMLRTRWSSWSKWPFCAHKALPLNGQRCLRWSECLKGTDWRKDGRNGRKRRCSAKTSIQLTIRTLIGLLTRLHTSLQTNCLVPDDPLGWLYL